MNDSGSVVATAMSILGGIAGIALVVVGVGVARTRHRRRMARLQFPSTDCPRCGRRKATIVGDTTATLVWWWRCDRCRFVWMSGTDGMDR
jgi:hypothetical protein